MAPDYLARTQGGLVRERHGSGLGTFTDFVNVVQRIVHPHWLLVVCVLGVVGMALPCRRRVRVAWAHVAKDRKKRANVKSAVECHFTAQHPGALLDEIHLLPGERQHRAHPKSRENGESGRSFEMIGKLATRNHRKIPRLKIVPSAIGRPKLTHTVRELSVVVANPSVRGPTGVRPVTKTDSDPICPVSVPSMVS